MTFKIRLKEEPTGTSQQKGVSVRGGQVHFYEKAEVRLQRQEYVGLLAKHRPQGPMKGPISLRIVFAYPERKSSKLKQWSVWKPTVPDLDNLEKLFLDAMTDSRFWEDDRQVVHKETKKILIKDQEDFQILVNIREVDNDSSLLQEEYWELIS